MPRIASVLWYCFHAEKSMKPFQIPINRLEIFLNNLNSCPTPLKSTALNRHGCTTELSKEGLSQGGDLGRMTEVQVGLPSKSAHVGTGTLPAEKLQQKTNIKKKKNLAILPVEGNRAPWLQPVQRCRVVTGILSVLFPRWAVLLPLFPASAQVDPLLPTAVHCLQAAPCPGEGKSPSWATPSAQLEGQAIPSSSCCLGFSLPENGIVFAALRT